MIWLNILSLGVSEFLHTRLTVQLMRNEKITSLLNCYEITHLGQLQECKADEVLTSENMLKPPFITMKIPGNQFLSWGCLGHVLEEKTQAWKSTSTKI